MKAYRGSRDTAPLILNLCSGWSRVISFTSLSPTPQRREYLPNRWLGGPQSWSGHFGGERLFFSFSGWELIWGSSSPVAQLLYWLCYHLHKKCSEVGCVYCSPSCISYHCIDIVVIIILGIQPLGRSGQRPEFSQVTGMGLVCCILGKFLGVACYCFPPLILCSHFSPPGASTSATTWEIPAAEVGTVGENVVW